jgi:dynein heavy chain
VSKVFQGISKSSPKAVNTEDDFVKLWAHECTRTFHDRLISDEDRLEFIEMIKVQMKETFKKTYDSIVAVKPLLFASFVPTVYPEGDTSKKPY